MTTDNTRHYYGGWRMIAHAGGTGPLGHTATEDCLTVEVFAGRFVIKAPNGVYWWPVAEFLAVLNGSDDLEPVFGGFGLVVPE